ncbi:MAG TPA: MoxR family ATPase, partial [Firmicutes bacterium]|nr:MoxR family ATPase [Bacillota bacterium]
MPNAKQLTENILAEMAKVIVGQEDVLEKLIIAVLTKGHVLMEGVPGIAKTLMGRTLSLTLDASFTRIQFTPDLMPSDVIGTMVFDQNSGQFAFRKGPVFTDVLLADEINRTPPKTQAALLEAMEERRISIEGAEYRLPQLFTVLATQNPIEYEGTYPLPEAQLDRFTFKLIVGYPDKYEEIELLKRFHGGFHSHELDAVGIKKVVSYDDVREVREEISGVKVDDSIIEYINEIAQASRQEENLLLGASPRAAITLLLVSKTHAACKGRDFVIPDDVQELAYPTLR